VCGACGTGALPGWYEAGVGDSAAERLRAQAALAAELNSLLHENRVRSRPLSGGVQILMAGPTGRQVVIQGVDEALDAVRVLVPSVTWGDLIHRLSDSAPLYDHGAEAVWVRRAFDLALSHRQEVSALV
jgi:hypothetical protein